jgi:nicotinamidase-related amidase
MSDVLLVIDVQQALVDYLAAERRDALLGTLRDLIGRARETGVPVVYVRHDGSPEELVPGTPGWEIARDIAPREGEPIVEKRHGDSFEETPPSDVLAGYGAKHVIAAGMQSDYCVAATIRGAAARGYDVTLVEDAHATYPDRGLTEDEIHAELHADARMRGITLKPAAVVFA